MADIQAFEEEYKAKVRLTSSLPFACLSILYLILFLDSRFAEKLFGFDDEHHERTI